MEIQHQPGEKSKNRNQLIIISGSALLILCCCCAVVVVVGVYAPYNWLQRNDTVPAPPVDEYNVPPVDFDIGQPPAGGLGNEILKNDTWQVMAPIAMGFGCNRPLGDGSTIEVLQEPDSNGVWREEWTVACASGDSYVFDVEFILDDSGATFNITPIQ